MPIPSWQNNMLESAPHSVTEFVAIGQADNETP